MVLLRDVVATTSNREMVACCYFSLFSFPPFRRIISRPGFFNLTATFRNDSDFPIPYFHTYRRNTTCNNCLPDSTLLNKKTKHIIWFVSHCQTLSKRERYVRKLSKHISIDIYGACGKKTSCGRDKRHDKCAQNMTAQYKFYFAAENVICKDYFTGKFKKYFMVS